MAVTTDFSPLAVSGPILKILGAKVHPSNFSKTVPYPSFAAT